MAPPPLTVRHPHVGSLDSIPRHWCEGNPVWTHLLNRNFLLFPLFEARMVRWARGLCRAGIDDPVLAEQLRGFADQEASHARHHSPVLGMLRRHGYTIDPILADARTTLDEVEAASTPTQSACRVAAIEHMFTTRSAIALRDRTVDHLPAPLRDLMLWHAAEEVEHQTVAFDALLALYRPSYLERTRTFLAVLREGAELLDNVLVRLLAHDGIHLSKPALHREIRAYERAFMGSRLAYAAALFDYLRPGFHPLDHGTRHLADAYFANQTMAA